MYNGLPPSCHPDIIQLKYLTEGKSVEEKILSFNFTEAHENSEFFVSKNIDAEGSFRIDSFALNCNGGKINFGLTEFIPIPKEKDEMTNMHLLITYDLSDPTEGIINVGQSNGPLDKTVNGKPAIK